MNRVKDVIEELKRCDPDAKTNFERISRSTGAIVEMEGLNEYELDRLEAKNEHLETQHDKIKAKLDSANSIIEDIRDVIAQSDEETAIEDIPTIRSILERHEG